MIEMERGTLEGVRFIETPVFRPVIPPGWAESIKRYTGMTDEEMMAHYIIVDAPRPFAQAPEDVPAKVARSKELHQQELQRLNKR